MTKHTTVWEVAGQGQAGGGDDDSRVHVWVRNGSECRNGAGAVTLSPFTCQVVSYLFRLTSFLLFLEYGKYWYAGRRFH